MSIDPSAVVKIGYKSIKFIIEFIEIVESNKEESKKLIDRLARIQYIIDKNESDLKMILRLQQIVGTTNKIAEKYRADYEASCFSSWKVCCQKLKTAKDYQIIRENIEKMNNEVDRVVGDTHICLTVDVQRQNNQIIGITVSIREQLSEIQKKQNEIHDDIKELKQRQKPKVYTEQKFKCIIDKLKQEYSDKYSKIQRLITDKSYPIEQSYVNLAIIENSEKQPSQNQKQDLSTIGCTTYEQIYGNKEPINVKDLFNHHENKPRKRLLVYGRAGIGKTTLCQYVAYQWAKGQLYQQYKCVIWIRLRNLSKNLYQLRQAQPYILSEIVKQECFKTQTLNDGEEEMLNSLLRNISSDILWLLDGYDELNVPDRLQAPLEELMNKQYQILTSRPSTKVPYRYDVELEITGFKESDVQAYVKHFFEDKANDGEKMITFLKASPNVWGIAHIPVSLEILCTSWNEEQQRRQQRQTTVTVLYDNMLEWMLKRYLSRSVSIYQIAKLNKERVFEECEKELEILDEIAFRSLESSHLIISGLMCNDIVKQKCDEGSKNKERDEWSRKIIEIGLLRALESNVLKEEDRDYYFIHLSFQEFFAARYVNRLFKTNNSKMGIHFVQQNKYNSRFQLVLTFLAGLLDQQFVEVFFNTLTSEPVDLIFARHLQILIVCLEEINMKQHRTMSTKVLKQIQKYLIFIVKNQNDHDLHSFAKPFLEVLGRSFNVLSELEIERTMLKLLNGEEKYFMVSIIGEIGNCSINVFRQLIFLFNDSIQYKSIYSDLANTVCTLFRSSTASNVLNSLRVQNVEGQRIIENTIKNILELVKEDSQLNYSAITHKRNFNVAAAILTLNEFENYLTPDSIKKIQVNLKIDYSLLHDFGYDLNKSITKPFVDETFHLLSSNDELERNQAIETSCRLCHLANDNICDKLIDILKTTSDDEVKEAVCEVFRYQNAHGKIKFGTVKKLEKTFDEYQTDEVIKSLLVKIFAHVLHNHKEFLASFTSNIVDDIATFCLKQLDDFENMDRRKVIELLKMLIYNSTVSKKIMLHMLNLLDDGSGYLYEVALDFFESIKEEFVNKYDVIERILNAFSTYHRDLCQKTTETLISICKETENTDLLKPLEMVIINSDDRNVKYLAAKILGEIDKVSHEVLSQILDQLKNINDYEKQQLIIEMLYYLPLPAASKPEIVEQLFRCLEEDTFDFNLLGWTIAHIWPYTNDESILDRMLKLFSGETVKNQKVVMFILQEVAKHPRSSVILNQLIDRVKKQNDQACIDALRLFCSYIEHPLTVVHLVDVAQKEKNTNIKQIVTETLFKLGRRDENNTTVRLIDVLVYIYREYDKKNDRTKIISSLLSFCNDETIRSLSISWELNWYELIIPLELLYTYLMTNNPLLLEIIFYQALPHSIAITFDKNEKCILVYQNNGYTKVTCESMSVLKVLKKKFSEFRYRCGLSDVDVTDEEKKQQIYTTVERRKISTKTLSVKKQPIIKTITQKKKTNLMPNVEC